MFYWHHKLINKILLYLIQFYTGFLNQSRYLQIEVGRVVRMMSALGVIRNKKTKKIIVIVELNIFINK